MNRLFEAVSDSIDSVYERDSFKEKTLEKLEPVSKYIKKIKMSGVNKHGQWGIFVYCYNIFDRSTGKFADGYSSYIPSDADDFMYQMIISEIETIYTDPNVKIVKD